MLRHLLIISLTVISFLGNAQIQRGITLDLDTQHILIGDQIKMTIEMRGHVNDRLTLPYFNDTLTKDIEIVSTQKVDTSYGQNIEQLILKQEVAITAWDSGVYTIPPIKGLINGDTAYGPGFMIGVYSFPLDSTNAITDIKPNVVVPLTFMDYLEVYWPHALITLFAVLIILGIIIWIKKRPKKEEHIIQTGPKIPAHELAFQRLRNLDEKKLWQAGKFKEYHVRLSEILREYLEERYQILAMEQTTEEILADLRPAGMSEDTRNRLKEVLLLMDLVKFAKQQPLANENEGVMKSAMIIVENTKLVEVQNEEEAEHVQ